MYIATGWEKKRKHENRYLTYKRKKKETDRLAHVSRHDWCMANPNANFIEVSCTLNTVIHQHMLLTNSHLQDHCLPTT